MEMEMKRFALLELGGNLCFGQANVCPLLVVLIRGLSMTSQITMSAELTSCQ